MQQSTCRNLQVLFWWLLAVFSIPSLLWQIRLVPVGMDDSLLLPRHEFYRHSTTTASTNRRIGACLMVRDDSIKLTEWMAYHYTVLPLGHVVVALDGGRQQERIRSILDEWDQQPGLSVELWWNDTYLQGIDPQAGFVLQRGGTSQETYDTRRASPEVLWKRKQNVFAYQCMRHHKQKHSHWILLTDTDEFLLYNYIHAPQEQTGVYHGRTKWHSTHDIDQERTRVRPIRQALPPLGQLSIVEFLEQQQPQVPRCLRLPGLTIKADESTPSQVMAQVPSEIHANNLMTLRFRKHAERSGIFSKVLLDLSRVDLDDIRLKDVQTIHNPSTRICGKNGIKTGGSGMDYIAAILRLNHYIGSLEAFLERGQDWIANTTQAQARQRKQRFRELNRRQVTVGDDDDIRPWIQAFVDQVGTDQANHLLRHLPHKPYK